MSCRISTLDPTAVTMMAIHNTGRSKEMPIIGKGQSPEYRGIMNVGIAIQPGKGQAG